MTKYIIAILTFSMNFIAVSQTTSLEDLLNFANTNSPEIQNASIDVEIAEQKIKEYTSAGLPKINGSLDFQNFINIPTTVIPASAFGLPTNELMPVKFGTDYNSNLSLRLDQLIFSARYIYGIRAANAYADLTQLIKKQKLAEFKEKISTLYYSILLINKNILLTQKSKEQIKKIFDYTQKMVKEGFLELNQLDEITLLLLQLENAVDQLKMNEELSLIQLKSNIGYPIDSALNLEDNFSEIVNSAAGISKNINANQTISYMLASQNTILSDLDLKVVKSEGYPSLSGFVNHQEMAMREEFNFLNGRLPWYPATVWGVRVNIPIFNSGEGKSKRTQKELGLLKSQNDLINIESQISALLIQLENNSKFSKISLKNAQESLIFAEKVLENEILKYKSGTSSVLLVSQAQNQVISAQQVLLKKEFNVITSQLAINKIINP